MKITPFSYLALLLFWIGSTTLAMAEPAEIYHLRQGDMVMISVWGDAALQKEVRVLPDGSVTFPLAGRVEVAGLATPEVESRIAEKLKVFLPEPQVTVVITNIEGNRAYILGKVLKPGPVTLSGPMTVLQALSMAGGLDKFADLGAIKLLRLNEENHQEVLSVHYDKLIQGQALESNVLLQSGDTIVVP